ncbi:MAG: hypothetical protein WCC17_18495 [Candidatus Nitrosopolaris sp.]
MKDDELLIGILLGGITGAAVLSDIPIQTPRRSAITRALKPLKFGPVLKKTGLEFAIQGHRFLGLLDTGSTAE